jgi:hypothetical protein
MANKETDLAVVKEGETVKGLVTSNDIYHAMRSYIIGKNMLESIPMAVRDIKISELMKTSIVLEFMETCG